MRENAHIQTKAHDYRMLESPEKGKEAPDPFRPLHIKKKMGETMTQIPKSAYKKYFHNPNARATQNYSVIEDISQTPCVMFSLEVL